MSTQHTPAETYLRTKYGAYRGHHEWRAIEEAFNAGRAALSTQAQTEQAEIERLRDELELCCQLKREYQEQASGCGSADQVWHTIDTAPKDGTPILVDVPFTRPRLHTAHWNNAYNRWVISWDGWKLTTSEVELIRWIPLPEIPE